MYFIGILEAKLIAYATQILTSKFQVNSLRPIVQMNFLVQFCVICTMSYAHIVFVQACLLLN